MYSAATTDIGHFVKQEYFKTKCAMTVPFPMETNCFATLSSYLKPENEITEK